MNDLINDIEKLTPEQAKEVLKLKYPEMLEKQQRMLDLVNSQQEAIKNLKEEILLLKENLYLKDKNNYADYSYFKIDPRDNKSTCNF